jgi:hypothetical protein
MDKYLYVYIIGVVVLSSIAAVMVLLDAKSNNFSNRACILWSVGTFLLPIVVLPLYLLIRVSGEVGNKYGNVAIYTVIIFFTILAASVYVVIRNVKGG